MNDFCLLIVSYHTTVWKIIRLNRSWDRDLHNFGPQLGQNCPFGLREEFLANYTSMFFIYLFKPYCAAKLKKKPLHWSWGIGLPNWDTTGSKLPICLKRRISGKFHLLPMIFICLLRSIMLQSCGSWERSFLNFVTQLSPIYPFGQKEFFWEISLKWFFSVYCAFSCSKVWKNP